MNSRIAIIEDNLDVRTTLRVLLGSRYLLQEYASGREWAEGVASDTSPDVVLLDINLGDISGLDLFPKIKARWPEAEVIILTGNATIDNAMEAGRLGAFTFLSKPVECNKLLSDIQCALEHRMQKEENSALRHALETMSGKTAPVFGSPAMREVVQTIERVAPSDVTILITGESGTGKEVMADLTHALSHRSKQRIVKINCAALPRELIESELFGSIKGAFTGAHISREGLFQQAEGGTLFLDEIAEMSMDTQSKLLRVLQDQEVRPVGSNAARKINCRIIAATNQNPQKAIQTGKLREDLFYRISAISVDLPPLRDRRDDILPLAEVFLHRFSAQAGRSFRGFTSGATDRLLNYEWPGNIRQLQNEIQRAVLLSQGPQIDISDLQVTGHSDSQSGHETDFGLLENLERTTITRVLREADGNKVETARRLGIGRQTLYQKLKVYGIED